MTIEERANELYCDADGYVKDLANDYMRLGFIKGVKEQWQIDINKTCEWLDEQVPSIGSFENDKWLSLSQQFRKFMYQTIK